MPGPLCHRQLPPIIVVFLTVLAISAGAEGQDRVDSSPGNEAGDAVQPAAAFPMGRLDPVPVEPEYDPLFDEYDETQEEAEVYDPLEPGNRAVYGFNRQVDRFLFNPVTKGYRMVVPDFARRSIRRVFINLNAPIYVMNNLFQLRLLDAVQTVGAFTMNMTFGFGGLFETGDGIRCELKHADFGQTMALYGVGSGPYLVIPVLGPTTTRDGIGWVIDRAFHPLTYVLGIPIQLMWGGGHGVSYRAEVAEGLAALEESALDPYAVMRSAYAQAREQAIEEARKQRPGRLSEADEDAIARVPEP
ncbi:MAG: MlaA family lipoprotein [Myxococcota bacterium]